MRKKMQGEMKIVGHIRLPALLSDESVGEFRLYLFSFPQGNFYVLEKGNAKGRDNILVRVQSACNLAHIFNSLRCDCQQQIEKAMLLLNKEGTGLLIYAVNHEGRGVGPIDHIRFYQKQDEGYDTVDSYLVLGLPIDSRRYTEVGDILKYFDIKRLRLLTNNPSKIQMLKAMGFEVEHVPLLPKLHEHNESQIRVKVEKLGHLISLKEPKGEEGK